MKHVLVGYDNIFGPWIAQRLETTWIPNRGHVIGLLDDSIGQAVAGVWFEGWNGASIMVHIAAEGKKWLNREFLWFICYYPFEQLKVNKVIAPIESSNQDSINFVEHFGFTLEATLKDAAPKGDLLLYTLVKEQANKWLQLKGKYRGQTESSPSS